MKIERKKMVFNKGTDDEEEKDMIMLDKETYELKLITEADVGKTFKIFKNPLWITEEQYEEIRKSNI